MWASVAMWFATSRTGRLIAAAGALALAVGVALLKVFGAGKEAERMKQDRQSLENQRHRAQVEDEIKTAPADERRKRLEQWAKEN